MADEVMELDMDANDEIIISDSDDYQSESTPEE